jgi:hypothetical protein
LGSVLCQLGRVRLAKAVARWRTQVEPDEWARRHARRRADDEAVAMQVCYLFVSFAFASTGRMFSSGNSSAPDARFLVFFSVPTCVIILKKWRLSVRFACAGGAEFFSSRRCGGRFRRTVCRTRGRRARRGCRQPSRRSRGRRRRRRRGGGGWATATRGWLRACTQTHQLNLACKTRTFF